MQFHAMRGEPQATINVTPMIDVLLVLLIVFMAIAPARSVGLEAAVPQNASHPPVTREDPVVLQVAADGSYRLNSEPVSAVLLRDRLIEIFERRGNRVLFVKAAPNLEFGAVAAALDTAHGVNIERVALMPRE